MSVRVVGWTLLFAVMVTASSRAETLLGTPAWGEDVVSSEVRTLGSVDPALESVVLTTVGHNATCKSNRCQPSRVWVVGVESTFLSPDIHGAPGRVSVTDAGTGLTNVLSSGMAKVEDDLFVAPRIWLGRKGETWGVVGRFWKLSESETAFDAFSGSPDTSGVNAFGSLEAYTIDLEATRDFCWRNWDMEAAFGARYAWFDHQSSISTTQLVGPTLANASALSARDFGGTGLTFALGGARPLRSRPSVQLFWNARGSVMWGDLSGIAETNLLATDGASVAAAGSTASSESDEDLFIGELQIGAQWEHQLRCVPASAFVRVAGEIQYWDANGVSASSFSAGSVAPATLVATGEAGGFYMDLFGFALAAGLTY